MNISITAVKLTVLERDVPGGKFAASDKAWGGRQKMLLVRLLTDQGVEGACFIGLHSSENSAWAIESISTVLRAELIGQNPLYRERIWHRMWLLRRRKRLSIFAIAALDAALWDIAGKLAGLPIYQLIGAARDRAGSCASSSYFDDPNAYVDDTLRLKALNYSMIKLFPGGTPKRDAEICTAVRKAVGPDTKLAMDAVFSYGRTDALHVGRVVQDLGFEWFEEPLQETDIQGYVELSRALDIPVAAGDTEVVNLASLPEYILRGAVDIIRCDVAWKGGITPAKRIADICDAFGLRCEFHHAGNALLNAANLHVILSMKGESYCEIMMPPELQEYGLTEYVRADKDGYVNAPTKPGLGYDIDWERIKRDTVAEV